VANCITTPDGDSSNFRPVSPLLLERVLEMIYTSTPFRYGSRQRGSGSP